MSTGDSAVETTGHMRSRPVSADKADLGPNHTRSVFRGGEGGVSSIVSPAPEDGHPRSLRCGHRGRTRGKPNGASEQMSPERGISEQTTVYIRGLQS